jgi:DNA invertase Pin-like site-specific DNA recombinase
MVAEVCLGKVGAVCAREVSRFARNSRDWQQLIEMCRVVDTVLVDQETIYAPRHGNDRLLLGLKGSLNEYELDLLRQRSLSARHEKVRRGELVVSAPVGFVKVGDRYEKDPDRRRQSRWSSTRSRNSEALDRHCSGSTSKASNFRRSRAMATRFGGDRATPLSTGWSRTQCRAAHMRMAKRPRRWDMWKRAQA